MKKYNVAIVGATGLVGMKFVSLLEEYNFPVNKLILLASKRSVGKQVKFHGKLIDVTELNEDAFNDVEICFLAAGGDISLKYAPLLAAKNIRVIDNSSAFRMDEAVGLIVPEINISDYKLNKIIANPNCSTIQAALPLKAIHDKYKIKRIIFATYQAVSGSGQKGIDDLNNCLNNQEPSFYPYNISQTCIPHIDSFLDSGYTKEEMKMVNETKKILHDQSIKISATCIRVPVLNAHGVLATVETELPFELDDVKQTISNFENIVLYDDVANLKYPTSIIANNTDKVYVGRIRRDLSVANGLIFYCTADNIRKGAAANAIMIAQKLIELDCV